MGAQATSASFESLTINRLKHCDVTWLYGPLVSASNPREAHRIDSQTDRKSILKRRREFDNESSSIGEGGADHKVCFHEDAVIIGYDGGLGYLEDDDNDSSTWSTTNDIL